MSGRRSYWLADGAVGCAIARALSARWTNVFLLEAVPKLATGANSRNSGVALSSLYCPFGSLKAKHCVRRNRLTYEFGSAPNVPHRYTRKMGAIFSGQYSV